MHLNRPVPALRRTATCPSPSLSGSQLLLQRCKPAAPQESPCGGSTPGEACGGMTAACTALWCCCPCGLVNLLVLVVYRVPAGICKLALRRRRRRRRMVRQGLLPTRSGGEGRSCQWEEGELAIHPVDNECLGKLAEENAEALELEKEMWSRFHGAGFWRSASQRETALSPGGIPVGGTTTKEKEILKNTVATVELNQWS